MATDTNVQNLIINKLTQEQYESITTPSSTELYLTPDESLTEDDLKTINGVSIVGSGNIEIDGGGLYYAAANPAITPVNGVATWTITHNLNTKDVQVVLYSSDQEIEKNVTVTSVNVVTLTFSANSAISANTLKAVVMAGGVSANATNLAAKDFSNVSTYLPASTTITVGTSGADFTTLDSAFSYLSQKWSNGQIIISIITDLTITDSLEIDQRLFNFPELDINGNNHTITMNFTTSGTYSSCLRIYRANSIRILNTNFVGGTNASTHILTGGYYTNGLLFSNCSFDNTYAGILAYNLATVKVESCKFYAVTFGMQAQQGGTIIGRGNTYGATNKTCSYCYNVYLGGIVRDGEGTYTNYTNYGGQDVNIITANGLIMKA